MLYKEAVKLAAADTGEIRDLVYADLPGKIIADVPNRFFKRPAVGTLDGSVQGDHPA